MRYASFEIIVSDNGETPLHFAAASGKGNCANCLLLHDANSEIKTYRGSSVVQCARSSGHPKLMESKTEKSLIFPHL